MPYESHTAERAGVHFIFPKAGVLPAESLDRLQRTIDSPSGVEGEAMLGSSIGPYRIIEALGEGGMGVVYRAQCAGSDQQVALKTVKALAPAWVHGIRREILALNRISHPGIVRILDSGVSDGRPWYAMVLLEGESVRRRIRRMWSPYDNTFPSVGPTEVLSATESVSTGAAPLNDGQTASDLNARFLRGRAKPPAAAGQLRLAISLVRHVCETLSFLHGEGFINCDLKPENILLVGHQPVIIDFGLSAYHPGGTRESLQFLQGRAGTRLYMSPEQRRGELVDARSDLYSAGCILYELVVGRPPIRVAAPGAEAGDQLLAPSEIVTGVPPALEEIILKLLEENVSDRYGYADEVAARLARLSEVQYHGRRSDSPVGRPYLYRARFVGRDDLIDRLESARLAATRGHGSLVLLGGESGVGKTRLAIELTRRVPPSQMRVLMTEVTPRAAEPGSTRAAPLQALGSLLRAVADRCREGGRDVVEQLLGKNLDVLAPYAPALADLPRSEHDVPPVALAPEAARRRLFGALAETLSRFSAERPLLWILDDLGWADELSLSFFASLTPEFLGRTPILLLASHRTEEPSELVGAILEQQHVISLNVPRLDPGAVRSLAGDMLATRHPPDGLVHFVEEQAEGNPFFVAEYMRAAVAEGVLYRSHGQSWRLNPGGDSAGSGYPALLFPRPLRELIEQRIRALSPAAQKMALVAAVVGRASEVETLYEVADLGEATAIGAIDELLRRQVVDLTTPGSIRFAHDKLREVSYLLAHPDERRILHQRVARVIEAKLRESVDPRKDWAMLGHHFAGAGQAAPAARYFKMAADHARSIYANADAIRLYEQALEQVASLITAGEDGDCGALQSELHESRGDVLALTGRREEARKAYDVSLAGTGQTSPARSRILRKQGRTWETHHQHAEALAFYGRAQAALAIDPDTAGPEERNEWIQVRIDQLWVHYWLNHLSEMDALVEALRPVIANHGAPLQQTRFYNTQTLRNLRRDCYFVTDETLALAAAARDASRSGVPPAEAYMAQVTYGLVLMLNDSLESSHAELDGALAYFRRAGDAPQQARCLTYMTLAARRRRVVSEVEHLVAQSMAASVASGMKEYIAAARANQAWVCLHNRDLPGVLTHAREALTQWTELPAVFPFRWMASLPLLEAALAMGELDEALRCCEGMLATGQHRLPIRVRGALNEALQVAQASASAAQPVLEKALQCCADARFR